RFQTNSTGPGEKIDHPRTIQRLRVNVTDDVEQAFARPVDGRPDLAAFGSGQWPTPEFTADDPHCPLPPWCARLAAAPRSATRPAAWLAGRFPASARALAGKTLASYRLCTERLARRLATTRLVA